MDKKQYKCQNIGCKRLAVITVAINNAAPKSLYYSDFEDYDIIDDNDSCYNNRIMHLYLCKKCNAHTRPAELEVDDIPFY